MICDGPNLQFSLAIYLLRNLEKCFFSISTLGESKLSASRNLSQKVF